MNINYAREILNGSPLAVARLITMLENEDERAYPQLEKLHPHTGRAYVIGITGSPGTGKSTLTDKLTQLIRRKELTVGIVAIDPSSAFTGGALLGDRVRMSCLNLDPGVYIRSMATRGFLGGLAKATNEVVKVLDAFGKDVIIIETVGVGQDEVDIVRFVDTTCLVLVPGLGDAIQSMKSGVMEIADIFIINKADHPGASQLSTEIFFRIEQDKRIHRKGWVPLVSQTVAVEQQGIENLWDSIQAHRKYLEKSGELVQKRKERIRYEMLQTIHDKLFQMIQEDLTKDGRLDRLVEDVSNHKKAPYSAIQEIIEDWFRFHGKGKESL